MNPPTSDQVVATLRRVFGPQWIVDVHGDDIAIEHKQAGSPFRPARRPPSWAELLASLDSAFGDVGYPRSDPLPLRWGKETDFVISAIQALDPHVKYKEPFTYREGFLAQPVVRLNARRDADGHLIAGRVTSFVNTSLVRRIASVEEHAATVDVWLTVLSKIGLHARHIKTYGSATTWQRREVSGITLRFAHAGMPIGDLVLIWNTDEPAYMVTDLGSGLERLRLARTRGDWARTVFGDLAEAVNTDTLDAVRTLTLMLGSGVRPSARGPGSAARRLLQSIPAGETSLGSSAAVRATHDYWSLVTRLQTPWHEIARLIDDRNGHG
ncbi:hypothetical protein GCM10009839_33980 [Catenulispora yoronensis]|uniref:Uncharacterized protein n=1 Tax=Catenulispora yoronensis TaxID=450799 RepID=A0ABP5FQ38_9ACTN